MLRNLNHQNHKNPKTNKALIFKPLKKYIFNVNLKMG